MKLNFASIAISALVALVVSLLLFFALPKTQERHSASDPYAEIKARGVIHAAYAVGAPLYIIDPKTGQRSGVFYDLVNEAANHLGLKVEWTREVGYGEMIEGLREGRYDIVGSGVWINADRGKSADYTIPVYYDAVYAYRSTKRQAPSSVDQINASSVVISTTDGELGQTIAKRDFPKARRLDLPQNADFSQMIANVTAGKADVVFLSAGAAAGYQTANPGSIVAIDPTHPLRIFPNAVLLPQGAYGLQHAMNYAFTEMLNNGDVDTILKRYEVRPGTFLRVAPPYKLSTPAE
jgi:ABC-type amino acid transport substrate-binding protein